jgi:hypothetical protein
VKKSQRKLDTKIFYRSLFILGVSLNVNLSLQKVRTVSFYTRGKNLLCTVQYTVPVFSVFSFRGTFEVSKTTNSGIAIDVPPPGSMNGPVDHSWNRAVCYELPV